MGAQVEVFLVDEEGILLRSHIERDFFYFNGDPEDPESPSSATPTPTATPYSNPTPTPTPALLAEWKFDGNANDTSGKGHHGTLYGYPSWTNGVSGQALYLDQYDDYVLINSEPELTFSPASTFSISLWFRQTNPSGYDGLIGSSIIPTYSYNYIYIYSFCDGPMIRANVEATENTGFNLDHYYGTVDNNWHHVVLAHDPYTIRLYYDGVLRQSGANTNIGTYNSDAPWSIGKLIKIATPVDRQFYGAIDEVQIYNYALQETPVFSMYGTLNPGAQPTSTPTPTPTSTSTPTPMNLAYPTKVPTYGTPISYDKPFYDKNGDKWFPIGWWIDVHRARGHNNPTNPDPGFYFGEFDNFTTPTPLIGGQGSLENASFDWEYGDLWSLHQQIWGDTIYNCIWASPLLDFHKRGASGSWSYPKFNSITQHYVRMLDTMTEFNNDYMMVADIVKKIVPVPTFHPDQLKPWDIFSAVTYPGPRPTRVDFNLERNAVRNLISEIHDHNRLAAWSMGDELYGGYSAQEREYTPTPLRTPPPPYTPTPIPYPPYPGFRSSIHERLVEYRNIIDEPGLGVNTDIPVYAILRAWGNYYENIPYWINNIDITDYLFDDYYYHEYLKHGFDEAMNHPKRAMDNVCVQELHGIKGYSMWCQGMELNGMFPDMNTLRFMAYQPWINGSRGLMFYQLSKTNESCFNYCHYYIAYEAYLMKDYLMYNTAHYDATIESNRDLSKAQFILKYHPTNGKVLLLVSNFTKDGQQATIKIHFHDRTITNVEQIVPNYGWAYGLEDQLTSNHWATIYFVMPDLQARAFILTLEG